MRTLIARASLFAGSVLLIGCASRPLPKYEKPLTRAAVMSVRTTAYTHTEADHVRYSNRNALGGSLQCGPVHSAAADWSRWPAGSMFRIRETGEIFQVDDYGWALAGTNTIDLYKPSRSAMNAWGVRRVTIENLRWGDPRQSLSILRGRSRHRHIKRMAEQLEKRVARWTAPVFETPQVLAANLAPESVPAPRATLVAEPAPAVAVAQPVTPQRTAQAIRPSGTTATREAFLNSDR